MSACIRSAATKGKGKRSGKGSASKCEIFTISIVSQSLRKLWREFVSPYEKSPLPEKYTFSFVKALHIVQDEQVAREE